MMSADLAEPLLLADLFQIEKGRFESRKEHDALVKSALESVAVLETEGGFSFGDSKLRAVKTALAELLVRK